MKKIFLRKISQILAKIGLNDHIFRTDSKNIYINGIHTVHAAFRLFSGFDIAYTVLISGMHNRVRHIPEVLLPFLSTVNKM